MAAAPAGWRWSAAPATGTRQAGGWCRSAGYSSTTATVPTATSTSSPPTRNGSRRRSSAPTRHVGTSRRPKQTTPQGGGGATANGSVIIDITALLELAAWCRQRLDKLPGGATCQTPLEAHHPPAPHGAQTA